MEGSEGGREEETEVKMAEAEYIELIRTSGYETFYSVGLCPQRNLNSYPVAPKLLSFTATCTCTFIMFNCSIYKGV